MKIDFTHQLVDSEGKTVLEEDAPVTIKTVLKRAILADATPAGQPIPVDEKVKRFDIFLKLRSADSNTDWTLDEIALLDKAVMVYSTLISGQLHYLLNNKTLP
jgi:hypothetical protein